LSSEKTVQRLGERLLPVPRLPRRRLIRFDNKDFARLSSARRDRLSPFPARLMKYVSMRIPDCGPFGETLLEASDAAIFFALFLNSPFGGCVESVLTVLTHLLFAWRGIISPRT
jgi:hypothetical protein